MMFSLFLRSKCRCGGRAISDVINAFVAENDSAIENSSRSACLFVMHAVCDGVVCVLPVASGGADTGVGTVDIGNRQKGRLLRVASLIALLQKKIFVQPLKLSMPRITKMLWRILTILMVMVVSKRLSDTLASMNFENLKQKLL